MYRREQRSGENSVGRMETVIWKGEAGRYDQGCDLISIVVFALL